MKCQGLTSSVLMGKGSMDFIHEILGIMGNHQGILNKEVAEYDLFFERSAYCVEDGSRETF